MFGRLYKTVKLKRRLVININNLEYFVGTLLTIKRFDEELPLSICIHTGLSETF